LVEVANDLVGMVRPLDGNNDGTAETDIGCYEFLNSAADSDDDTMDDGWEYAHYLRLLFDDAGENPDNDMFNNAEEYIADTDPHNSNDYFRITTITNGIKSAICFNSSSNRIYSLMGCSNILDISSWQPAAQSRMGVGGADSMQSTNTLPIEWYKMKVGIPR